MLSVLKNDRPSTAIRIRRNSLKCSCFDGNHVGCLSENVRHPVSTNCTISAADKKIKPSGNGFQMGLGPRDLGGLSSLQTNSPSTNPTAKIEIILKRTIKLRRIPSRRHGRMAGWRDVRMARRYCPNISTNSSIDPTTPSNSLYISSGSTISGI